MQFVVPKYRLIAIVSIPLILAVLSVSAWAGPRYDTPEATIQTYIDALRRGDQPAVSVCFEPEAHDFYLPGPIPIDQFIIRKRIVYGPSDEKKWKGVGYTARMIRGDIGLEVEETIDGTKNSFYYRLRRVRGQWKIVVLASDTR